ncbi:ATP-dependent helicase HrpA [Luteibacter sp. UNC138MFCol5.1]|uniref:ATP-dependent RNA helicase HrpA n=1 Tax=Luteibacter sp. UNC138MFCol5.1 TaxID=1502774 RepID=UPI0008D76AD2|nr:ATP-dependent RNA helicase HrpA [Luteibacter sp. UNC138MFCol5.1]SEO66076.1 ATP-dependent helicase HrpA [Luteibacter sp. UNC138MFCol5.1]
MSTPTTPARPSSPDPRLRELRHALDQVASRDFGRLLGRWRNLSRKPDAGKLDALATEIAASAARRAARKAAKPTITVDASLPIAARADDIVKLIRENQVVVLAGETGSGKTTQLPKLCLAAGRGEAGLIGCTQPRRLAARSVATRVAEELGTPIGDKVGFQVRFTEKVSDQALIKFMTDGILLAETQSDPWLSAYDTIIIDEAHERSLNIDFLLGYLKRLAARRPELKIIVTSATIDTGRFAAHFGDAPVVEVEGRTYPVEVRYRPPGERVEGNVAQQVADAMDEITRDDPRGDVLVFLPGEREIRDTHLLLSRRQYRETEVLALYARLSASEQDRVFRPGPKRRIVLATNVAETSLTVPRIRFVVDSGTARVKRYSQRGQLERLHIEPISQAAANQRKGRCGRVGPGVCYRLYEEADFALRPEFTDPELLRSSLANVILRMLALDLGEVDDFPFLEAPDPRVVADGYRRLAEIGAIDDDRRLTEVGRTVARLPIDVQLARMMVEARRLGSAAELTTIVAFLSIQDPRERPPEARGQADAAHAQFADPKSDFVGVLNLWRAYLAAAEELTSSKLRDWCSRHFLSFMRMREWRELHRQLVLVMRDLGWSDDARAASQAAPVGADPAATAPRDAQLGSGGRRRRPDRAQVRSNSSGPVPEGDALFEAVHRSLLAGLPTQVGHKDEKGVFRGTRERRFQVFPGSALAKAPPAWIFSAQILDIGGRVWAMMNARVDPAWIESQAAHLVRATARDAHWSRKRGTVVAYEQVTLFGLVLVERRPVTFQRQDPRLAHEIFLREGLVRGDLDSRADFVRANARVLEQAHDIEAKQRRAGLLKTDEELAAFFDGKLPESISDTRALDAWYRKASPGEQAALRWTLADVMDAGAGLDPKAFPASLAIGQHTYRLEYRFVPGDPADGVTIHVPLAFLNALPAARGDWLVGGLLTDKVAELIRSLPKAQRRNFVPAPDFARAFAEAEAPRDQPLVVALAAFLKRTTGVDIDASAFEGAELPPHLLMHYRVHDENGRTVAEGRDLAAIRAQWEGKAREAFSRKTDVELTREDIVAWDFESIPKAVRSEGGLEAYPALVDLGEAVALRVFERADEAAAAHVGGVERLLRQALAPEFKRARRQLPIANPLSLKYAPMGSVDGLRDDLVEGGFADLIAGRRLDARTQGEFEALRTELGRELFGAAMARQKLAEPIIEAQAELKPWMDPPLMGFAKASYDDLREQLAALLQPGFLRELSPARLAHIPRYLKAMRLRAERLRQDPARDQSRMLQVLPYWRALLNAGGTGLGDTTWGELRWLLEEWRVSLFAQELKTAEPVSAKRLARALETAQAAR